LATAGHARVYAPEIIVRGAVLTGVPFFSPKALIAVRDARPRDIVDPQLGYNFLALSLAQMADRNFSMNDYLSDKARPVAERISTICNRQMRTIISDEKLTYDNSFIRSPNSGLERAFELMQYPKLGLKVPIFIASGAMDKDTPLRMQQALVSKLCNAGSQVHSVVYKDKAHLSTLSHSINDAMEFVQAVRLEKLTDGNCSSGRSLQ
jgi:pimeloyl-ACP methyl ester carboxylesterase